jgi:chromosome segregation ATPase
LNRKYAELRAKQGPGNEDAGPMEIQINNMKKKTEELKQNILNVQKQWITNQLKLINDQQKKQTVSAECDELKTKSAILESKKLRLNNQVNQFSKEIENLKLSRKLLESEMRKLNEVFAKNKDSKTKLANDNFNIEHEFKQKLKELENESIKLENQISQLKEEKADILAEIVEAERQILLWERKI